MKNGEYYYEGVRGGKTGYTDASGNTLVTYCKRGNITLVAVILNSTSAANAYSDTASLFNYGFENFEKVDMKVSMEPVTNISLRITETPIRFIIRQRFM